MFILAVVFIILWALGFFAFHVLGNFIHILLIVAVIVFLVRIIKGENPLK